MNKETQKKAEVLMKTNKLDAVWMTEDGQGFKDEHDARQHAKRTGQKAPERFPEIEILEDVDDSDAGKAKAAQLSALRTELEEQKTLATQSKEQLDQKTLENEALTREAEEKDAKIAVLQAEVEELQKLVASKAEKPAKKQEEKSEEIAKKN